MKALGYCYDENKQCYYTDGHERDDVGNDREDRFLINYFEAELQTYIWVQIPHDEAVQIEDEDASFSIAVMRTLI